MWAERGSATAYTAANGGKPWKYLLIPHDAIFENMTLPGLVNQLSVGGDSLGFPGK